jgi:hypothetical protein
LIHKPSSRVNYQIKLQTIHELTARPSCKLQFSDQRNSISKFEHGWRTFCQLNNIEAENNLIFKFTETLDNKSLLSTVSKFLFVLSNLCLLLCMFLRFISTVVMNVYLMNLLCIFSTISFSILTLFYYINSSNLFIFFSLKLKL